MSIDPSLQMFIQACCNKCFKSSCEGAFNIKHRAVCSKYKAWQKLSGDRRAKLFSQAIAGESIMLEELSYGK